MGWSLAALMLLALGPGCGDIPRARECPGRDCENDDAGPRDGSLGDAGPWTPPPANTDGGVEPSAPGFTESGRIGDNSCWDERDNDDSGAVDCEDRASCGATAYCCVGSTDPACCTSEPTIATAFDTCSGDADGCAALVELFGAPTAQIEGGVFVPNGTTMDSGAVLGSPIDGRTERISLSVVVDTPDSSCDCLDAVAFGVGTPPDEHNPRPTLDVAVIARRAYQDIALVVEGEVLWSRPDAGGRTTIELELHPDGTLSLRLAGEPDGGSTGTLDRARWVPRSGRRILLWGRTPNRAALPEHTSIVSVTVDRQRCEVPDAWVRSPAPLDVDGVSPTVVRHGDTLWMATEAAGELRLFHHDEATGWRPATDPWVQTGALHHPELVVESGALVLYAERRDDTGPHIVRLERLADGTWQPPARVQLPGGPWGQPAVLWRGETDRWLAATHASDAEIALFHWNVTEQTYLLSHTVRRGADHAHFDQDEVADPELAEDDAGLIRLYYAGRRGTRWAIGMQVSQNGAVWRNPAGLGRSILAASGRGHDALGVRAPAVHRTAEGLRLYHTTSNGLEQRVSHAAGAGW